MTWWLGTSLRGPGAPTVQGPGPRRLVPSHPPSRRRVKVRADYPRDAEFVARRSKQITMGIRSGQTGGGDR
jgi:hypothetical protein